MNTLVDMRKCISSEDEYQGLVYSSDLFLTQISSQTRAFTQQTTQNLIQNLTKNFTKKIEC